jgi:hypothetical protein
MDHNTVALLDFGGGVCVVACETGSGNITGDFAAACYFGTRGEIRGLQLSGELRPPPRWLVSLKAVGLIGGSHWVDCNGNGSSPWPRSAGSAAAFLRPSRHTRRRRCALPQMATLSGSGGGRIRRRRARLREARRRTRLSEPR